MIAVGRHQQIVAKVDAIGQEHICEGTLVPVLAKGLEHNFFFKTKAEAACFARWPKAWSFSGQSMPLRRIRSARLWYRTSIVSLSRTETTGPEKLARACVADTMDRETARRTLRPLYISRLHTAHFSIRNPEAPPV
jgi:hypothetical protein